VYLNMADVAEEDQVIAACSSLVVAASLGAAAILNKRKKRTHSTRSTIHQRARITWSVQCPFVGVGHR